MLQVVVVCIPLLVICKAAGARNLPVVRGDDSLYHYGAQFFLFTYSNQNRQQVSWSGFSSVMIGLFLAASCRQPYASLQYVLEPTLVTRHSNNSNRNLRKHGLHDTPFVLTKMSRSVRSNHRIGLWRACTGGPYPLVTRRPLERVLEGEVQLFYYLISVRNTRKS
jgi:hypothetical protein